MCKIAPPKSHTSVVSKNEKEDWRRNPTLQGKEDDKLLAHFMSIYGLVEDVSNECNRADIEACLDALIEWRNIVYTRITTKFPTKVQLRDKMPKVSNAAIKLHIAFHGASKCIQPYIHHLLHCKDWLAQDLVDMSAEAREHLNKL